MPASKISLLRLPRFRRLSTSMLLNSVGMMGEGAVASLFGVSVALGASGSGCSPWPRAPPWPGRAGGGL